MPPRVVVIGLASDFGCQVQMTNMEDHLLDVLGLIDLQYWQLASSGHMPREYDVAVIEGAVTTVDHVELLKRVRDTASAIIAVGSCAVTGGIPALASTAGRLELHVERVYGQASRLVADGRIPPSAVDDIVTVDYHVPGCPIQPHEFVATLHRALMGLSDRPPREPLCAECKVRENACLIDAGTVCLGLVTRTGCGARCVTLGRACTGCRGIAEDANMAAAHALIEERGLSAAAFDAALTVYNPLQEVSR